MQKQGRSTGSLDALHPFLQYFSEFALPSRPASLEELADGVFLLQFARTIEGFRVEGEAVQGPRTLEQRYSNLKTLFRSIESFWSGCLGAEIEGEEVRLVEAARGSAEEVGRLLELLIKTAVQADNKRDFIEPILRLSHRTQEFLRRIVEPLNSRPTDSPRKEKEKRMLDKIFELHHENADLQAVLREVCEEKAELEGRARALEGRLGETARELEQLQFVMREEACTPQKRRPFGVPDTSDRKDSLIDSLRLQLAEMASQHERELQVALVAVDRARHQAAQLDQMRDELALSREIIASHKEFRADAQLIEQQLAQAHADAMDRDNHLACLRQQLDRAARTHADLEAALTAARIELQRKHLLNTELIARLEEAERRSPTKDSHGNLLLDLPGLVNTEAEAYIETNRGLREELERSRAKLEESQRRMAQQAAELEALRGCGEENGKLRQMVVELSAERGEENEILVSSLYHLRQLLRSRP